MSHRTRFAAVVAALALAAGGVALVSTPAQAASCTNWVDPGGIDSNSGTSASSAWKTIGHAAANVGPGAVVCVTGGATYTESVQEYTPGTAAAPIVFQPTPGTGTPVIDGTGVAATGTRNPGFLLYNTAYITITGFEIRDFTSTSPSVIPGGIFVGGSSTHIQILDNTVHGISGECADDCNGQGITMYGESASTANEGSMISGNEVYGNKLGKTETVTVSGNVTGFTIVDNYIHDNDNIGIDAVGYENACASCGELNRARAGTIEHNTVVNSDDSENAPYSTFGDAAGIYVDGGTGIVIQRNTVRGSDFGIQVASETAGKTSDHVIVSSNFISGSKHAGIGFGGYKDEVGGSSDNWFINNTLANNVANGDTTYGEIFIQHHASNNTVANNIVVASTTAYLRSNATDGTGLTMNGNWYYSSVPGATWSYNGATYNSFAAFQAPGYDTAGHEGTNPNLVSATDLHLQSGSPAENAGVTIANTQSHDIDGQTRIQGSAIDAGADEIG